MTTTNTNATVLAMGYYETDAVVQPTWNPGISITSALLLFLFFTYCVALISHVHHHDLSTHEIHH
jgi:hypothetical protein